MNALIKEKLTILMVLTAFVAVMNLGCGARSEKEAALSSVNKTNMDRLVNLYLRYQMQHRWQGPENEADFRTYIQGQSAKILQPMGVDVNALDGLFTSERDGQPFVIRYGVEGNSRGSHEAIVFEAEGVGGKRWVGFTSSTEQEVSDPVQYEGLLSGELKPPQPEQRGF